MIVIRQGRVNSLVTKLRDTGELQKSWLGLLRITFGLVRNNGLRAGLVCIGLVVELTTSAVGAGRCRRGIRRLVEKAGVVAVLLRVHDEELKKNPPK